MPYPYLLPDVGAPYLPGAAAPCFYASLVLVGHASSLNLVHHASLVMVRHAVMLPCFPGGGVGGGVPCFPGVGVVGAPCCPGVGTPCCHASMLPWCWCACGRGRPDKKQLRVPPVTRLLHLRSQQKSTLHTLIHTPAATFHQNNALCWLIIA